MTLTCTHMYIPNTVSQRSMETLVIFGRQIPVQIIVGMWRDLCEKTNICLLLVPERAKRGASICLFTANRGENGPKYIIR